MGKIIDIRSIARPIIFVDRKEKWEKKKKEDLERLEQLNKRAKELINTNYPLR